MNLFDIGNRQMDARQDEGRGNRELSRLEECSIEVGENPLVDGTILTVHLYRKQRLEVCSPTVNSWLLYCVDVRTEANRSVVWKGNNSIAHPTLFHT